MVRVGVPPPRALLALARRLGGRTDDVLADPRLVTAADPALASRAGQTRLRELQRLVAGHPAEAFARELAPIMCGALRDQATVQDAARRLRARAPVEAWTALLRLGPDALDRAVASAAKVLPDLATPRARGYVRDTRHELARAPVAPLVIWLCRAAGPGAAGQSIAIRTTPATIGGPGSPTVIADDDPRLLPNVAEIVLDGNDALLTPLSGPVELDGERAQPGCPLLDAQTLGLGACHYVVRLVRRDVMLADPARAAPSTQR
jgi:hypothetical protein